MRKRKDTYRLFILMIFISFLLTLASIVTIYKLIWREKKTLLREMCINQKEVIQSIFKETNDVNAVLNVLLKQRDIMKGLGTTGEFTMGYLKNDSIVFTIRSRQKIKTKYLPVSLTSDLAAPMKYALANNTGFIQGLDYKGNEVLSYSSFIPELNWGIVAKMDISEVHSSFYKAGLFAIIFSFFLILTEIFLFKKVSRPISKKIEDSEETYRRLFEYSVIPIWKEDFSEVKKYFDKLTNAGITDFRAYFEAHKDEVNQLAALIKVVEINQKSVEFFGAENKEDVIKNLLYYFTQESLAVFREEMIVLAEGGRQFECEIPIRAISGDIKILYLQLSVVAGYEDTLANVLVSFFDITKRKLTERLLSESETRYRRLFESAKDGILILNADTGMIVDVNPFLIELLGYSKEQFIKKKIWEIGFLKDFIANKNKFLELQQNGYVHYDDLPLKTANQNMINVEFVSNVYLVNNERVIQCNIRDITERVRFEKVLKEKNYELEEINATKDKFFKIIAHDMKNPFISLLGASELLFENAHKYDTNKIVTLTRLLNDSAKSGYDMLLNLLDWARSQAGNILFQPEKIILKELVENNISNLAEFAVTKKIKLNIDIANDIQVYADKNMLNTILRNLISNALKFTFGGGTVTLGTKRSNESITVFVADTGVGIEKSDFGKLFRTDMKFSLPGTNYEDGTGLGLLLCKEFVEKHGGKIWVDSEVKKGSTFYFNLQKA